MCCQTGFFFIAVLALLTVSFFVLLSARKSDSQGLKAFGYVIAVLLWISSAFVLASGVIGRHSMMMGRRPAVWGKQCKPMMHEECEAQEHEGYMQKKDVNK